MLLLNETLKRIGQLDASAMTECQKRMDQLVKPIGSLGRLETLAIQLAGITGEIFPDLSNRTVVVMAADHGVCEEGVAAAPQEVTKIQTKNIINGVSGLGPLCRLSHADLLVVDIGIKGDLSHPSLITQKVRHGTDNLSKGPAMTYDEAVQAIEVGIHITQTEIDKGRRLIATGEMGIGNTTPSTAILSVLGDFPPAQITGLGANLPEDKRHHKAQVIQRSIQINQPNNADPLDVLSKVGGLEIAGMVGIILGCAANRVPCVIDGYISTVSALLACQLNPAAKDYLIPSHYSVEKGAATASKLLGLRPMLDLEMRLGEGSGAALAFCLIDAAVKVCQEMITFEESGIQAV
jgi:nicotinate-nucleotide--dimethylbenzimidazole phosphoribosyltransferase